jgi:hypothetical protein
MPFVRRVISEDFIGLSFDLRIPMRTDSIISQACLADRTPSSWKTGHVSLHGCILSLFACWFLAPALKSPPLWQAHFAAEWFWRAQQTVIHCNFCDQCNRWHYCNYIIPRAVFILITIILHIRSVITSHIRSNIMTGVITVVSTIICARAIPPCSGIIIPLPNQMIDSQKIGKIPVTGYQFVFGIW